MPCSKNTHLLRMWGNCKKDLLCTCLAKEGPPLSVSRKRLHIICIVVVHVALLLSGGARTVVHKGGYKLQSQLAVRCCHADVASECFSECDGCRSRRPGRF